MTKKTNIFLITIDCFRADFLSIVGKVKNLTPNLDKIAKEGSLFTNAFANGPTTRNSFPSIFTSTFPLMYPETGGLTSLGTTFVEILKRNRYRTAGLNSNPFLSSYYGYDRSFDFFFDVLLEKESISLEKVKNKIINLIKNSALKKILDIIPLIERPYRNAKKINQKAISWLNKNGKDFFVWIHYMDAHYPYLPPRKYREIKIRDMRKLNDIVNRNLSNVSNKTIKQIKHLYGGAINYIDDELGKFFEALKRMNLFDNSLFIITADHGEQFREHGSFSHPSKLYEELIHVPLIIKGPGLPKGNVVDEIVALMDIAPTILEYAGIEPFEEFYGKSLIPLLIKSDKMYERKGVISEVYLSKKPNKLISFRTKNWKLIFNQQENSRELFNLNKDPAEKENVYNVHTQIGNNIEKKIDQQLKFEKLMHDKATEMEKIKKVLQNIKF